jgi:hypothetical protein
MKRARRKNRGAPARLCRFNGCDESATTTLGVTPLCALHRSHVLDMLDHGGQPAATLDMIASIELFLADGAVPTAPPTPGR